MPWGIAAAAVGAIGANQAAKTASKGQRSTQSNELDPDIKKYVTGPQGIMPAAQALYGADTPQFARFDPAEIQGQDYLLNYANYLGGGGYDPNFSSGYQSPALNKNPKADLKNVIGGGDGVATPDDVTSVFREYAGRDPTPYELEYYTGKRSDPNNPLRQRSQELINDIINPGKIGRTQAWYSGAGPTPYKGNVMDLGKWDRTPPPGATGYAGGTWALPGGPAQAAPVAPPTQTAPAIPDWQKLLQQYQMGGFPMPGGVPPGVI